jgi:hypothetical protein
MMASQRSAAVGYRSLPVLVDDHLELIEAELDPVTAAKLLGRAAAYRFGGLVEKRAIGAEIMQFPIANARAINQPAMPLRQMALGIGDDPSIVLAAADGKLAAADLASLGRHVVRTADHDKLQGHVRAHSCDGRWSAANTGVAVPPIGPDQRKY